MARNDVVRATHKIPPKKEAKERQIRRLVEEREAATPKLVRGREPSPEEKYGVIRAARNPVPHTLATALGAEVDPMETAKRGYHMVASGEVEDPVLSPGAARVIGSALAGYQGLETVAGATGIGNSHQITSAARLRSPGVPRVTTVPRVFPVRGGKPLVVLHSMSPESMKAVARNGQMINPSASITRADIGTGWRDHLGGDLHDKSSSGGNAFTVSLDRPNGQGFARATDMYTSTVNHMKDPLTGDLLPQNTRLAAYQAERVSKLTGSPQPWGEFVKQFKRAESSSRPLKPDSQLWPRPMRGRDYALDLTRPMVSKEQNFPIPARDRARTLIDVVEALGVQSTEADRLLEASLRPSFRQRVQMYSDVLRSSGINISPQEARGLYTALENMRYGELTETLPNELARYTVEYKPVADVAIKGRTVFVEGSYANALVPELQSVLPDTKFINVDQEAGSGRSVTDVIRQHAETFENVKGGNTRSAAKGGDASGTPGEPMPASAPSQPDGPRIVINPAVFHDKRDAACVAWNEAFRLVMEENGFEPVSEPTEAQRKFFADTAYADDELQLRRTILARIATLDTSVKDPTDEQLEETAEMLEMVMEVGAPQNEWEQSAVQRLHDVVVRMRESPREAAESPAPSPKEEGSVTAAMAGGRTMTRGEYEWLRNRQAIGASLSTQQRNILDATVDDANKGFVHLQLTGPEPASPEPSTPEPASPEPSTPEPTPAQPAQEPSTPAPKPGSMEDYISRGWHFGATGGGLERETIMGTKQYIPQNLVRAPGMRIPNKSEVDWLRRRKADGGRLSAQQEQILAYDDMMSQY